MASYTFEDWELEDRTGVILAEIPGYPGGEFDCLKVEFNRPFRVWFATDDRDTLTTRFVEVIDDEWLNACDLFDVAARTSRAG